MKTLFAVGGLALLTNLGCSAGEATPPGAVTGAADSAPNYTITANSVGDFVIGKSTLAEILGQDTPEARRQFANRGLNFQFDRGVTLTGVTVSSADYQLENGLAVGASADAVRKAFGEPKQTKMENRKFSFDALVYDDFAFVLAGDVVSAIFVGGGQWKQRPARDAAEEAPLPRQLAAAIELRNNLLRLEIADWPGETLDAKKRIQQYLYSLGISSTGHVLHIGTYRLTEASDFGKQGDQVFHFLQKDLFGARLSWSCLVNVDNELTTILYDVNERKRKLTVAPLPPLKASSHSD